MSLKALGALLLLSALWGGSFLFIRVAAPVLGPVVLMELRVLLAGLALLGYAAARRKLAAPGPHWRHYLVIGVINSALPFVLVATAELRLPASLAATLNATTPLFGALAAAAWAGEVLTARRVGGLLLGFLGVGALVGLGPVPVAADTLLSIGASLLAAASYGAAAVYTRVAVRGGEPLALATYSQLFAALALLPAVPFALPDRAPAHPVIASVLLLALLSTALAYILYFYLIVNAGATRATMVTYVAPAFGMLWGALFLGEPIGIGSLAGFGLILASLAAVSGQPGGGQRPARARSRSSRACLRPTPQR